MSWTQRTACLGCRRVRCGAALLADAARRAGSFNDPVRTNACPLTSNSHQLPALPLSCLAGRLPSREDDLPPLFSTPRADDVERYSGIVNIRCSCMQRRAHKLQALGSRSALHHAAAVIPNGQYIRGFGATFVSGNVAPKPKKRVRNHVSKPRLGAHAERTRTMAICLQACNPLAGTKKPSRRTATRRKA